MNSKARITFRFDNQGNAQRGRNEEPQQEFTLTGSEESSMNERASALTPFQEELRFTETAESYKTAFQDNPEALEALIRGTDSGPGASPVDLGEPIKREVPYLSAVSDAHRGSTLPRRRKIIIDVKDEHSPSIRNVEKGPSWFKVAASVTGAVATGALFGYLILSLFTGQNAWKNNEAIVPAVPEKTVSAPPSVQTPELVTGGQEGTDNEAAGTTIELNRRATDYYLLQYGVFSSQEGMQTALSQLDQRGVSAAASAVDKFRVYAGIAGDKNEAARLAEQLDGLEVYITRLTIPALSSAVFEGDAGLLDDFLSETDKLISTFSSVTNDQLQKEKPERFDAPPGRPPIRSGLTLLRS